MSLPLFKSQDQSFMLMQTSWKSKLDPFFSFPLAQGLQLSNIVLQAGSTTFNHSLGRMQRGWIITDTNANATIFRSGPFNSQTLTLGLSIGSATVSLWVY